MDLYHLYRVDLGTSTDNCLIDFYYAAAHLVVPLHQVLHLTPQDLDVGGSQEKHPQSTNHIPMQLQLHTRPSDRKRQQCHKPIQLKESFCFLLFVNCPKYITLKLN